MRNEGFTRGVHFRNWIDLWQGQLTIFFKKNGSIGIFGPNMGSTVQIFSILRSIFRLFKLGLQKLGLNRDFFLFNIVIIKIMYKNIGLPKLIIKILLFCRSSSFQKTRIYIWCIPDEVLIFFFKKKFVCWLNAKKRRS